MKVVSSFVLLWALLLTRAGPCSAQTSQAPAASPEAPVQPLSFSHKKHAGEMSMACTFCHVKPDPGVQMTLPATAKCMVCHASVAADKPDIQKLAEFNRAGKPIPWVQVYSVPGFVFWSHDIHLGAKVECVSCHGVVTKMDTIAKVTEVTTMGGCVSCHKQRDGPTGCLSCHETSTSRLLMVPFSTMLRRIIDPAGGI